MARIEQVKVHRGSFHAEGSPVAVEAYALLIDRKTGKYYAQVKFANVCGSGISSIAIVVTVRTLGKDAKITHIYPAINLRPGASYGSQEAVPLGDAQAVDIEVAVSLVELRDGTRWEPTADAGWSQLPERRSLEALGAPESSLGMYRSVFKHAKYIPWTSAEIWQCSCGKLNPMSAGICLGCGFKASDVMAASDEESLAAAERGWRTAVIGQVASALTELADRRAIEEDLARKKAERDAELERQRAAQEKELAEKKAAREKADLAKAHELIEGGSEGQLLEAIALVEPIHGVDADECRETARNRLARLKSERLAELKAKRRKKYVQGGAVAVAAAIAAIVFGYVVIPAGKQADISMKRRQAEQLISEGGYDDAMAIYTELDDTEAYAQTQLKKFEAQGDEALANENFEKAIGYYQDARLDDKVHDAMFAYVKKYRDSTSQSWEYLEVLKNCNYEGAADLYSELYNSWSVDVGFAVVSEDEHDAVADGGIWPFGWSDSSTWQRGATKSSDNAALADYGDRKYIYALFKASGGPKNLSTKVFYSTTMDNTYYSEEKDGRTGSITLSSDGQIYCVYLDSDWMVTRYTIDSYYIDHGRVDIGSKTISAQ